MRYEWLLVTAALAASVACEAPEKKVPTPEAPAESAQTYHYSPFVVQVSATSMVFDRISFKDVGLRASADPQLLETIAESVSYDLQSAPELGVQESRVEYLAEYTDPDNHRACEAEHLYVDVWGGAPKWGYSLWSGCGEADNFAWEQVSAPNADAPLAEQVAPLTEAITAKLVNAHQQKCFVKHC